MKHVASWPRSSSSGWQFLLDVIVVLGVWTAVLVFSGITADFKRSDGQSFVMAVVATVVMLVIMQRRGLYAGRPALPRTDEISRVFVAVVGSGSALAVYAAFLDWHIGAREILIGGTLIFGCRMLVRGFYRELAKEIEGADRPERVIIVGTGEEARDLADLIVDHPESRFHLVGAVGNLAVAERSGLDDCWIGPTSRLTELMAQHQVTGAIVTANGFRGEQFRAITQQLFRCGYDVHLTTGVSRMGEGRFDVRSLSHEPLVVMERNRIHPSHLFVKRVIDVVGASIVLILASPIMAATAALIWLEDRGPITYTASRAGRRGQFFRMYKFRSMVTNADELKKKMEAENERTGPLFKMSNDPRITRIGKIIRETSIDELPQLLNVLKGDMSLVGPRPALPEEEAAFDEELRDRFEVRPGITGLWQVEARSNAAFNAYRRLDLHYVENWTLWLDLRILLATAEQVAVSLALAPLRLFRRGAGTDGITTGSSAAPASAAAPSPTPAAEPSLAPAPLAAAHRANGVPAAPLHRPVGSPVPLAGAAALPTSGADPFQLASITAEHRATPLYSQLQAGHGAKVSAPTTNGGAELPPRRQAPMGDDTVTDQMPAIRALPANGYQHPGSGSNGGGPIPPSRLGEGRHNGHGALNGHAAPNGRPGGNGHRRLDGNGLDFDLPDDSRPLGSDEVTSQTPAIGPVTSRRRRPPLDATGRAQPQHRVRTRRGVHDVVDPASVIDLRSGDDEPPVDHRSD